MQTKLSSPIAIIRQSIILFFKKENFVFFLKIYAVLLPFSILAIVRDYYLSTQTASNDLIAQFTQFYQRFGVMTVALIIVVVAVMVLYAVVSFWVSAAGILATSSVVYQKAVNVSEVYKNSWKILWRFAVLEFLLTLMGIFGTLLLIIPGVLVFVWFHFSNFELVTKNFGIKQSLGNSKRLVTGRFWKVFGRFIVFAIFTTLIGLLFSLIPYGIGTVVYPFFGALTILPYFLLYKELSY